MHIGFVAHNFVRGNGQGRINYEIVRHALTRGHCVTLLAGRVDDDLASATGLRWERILPWPVRPNLLYGPRAAASAGRLLRRARARDDGRFDLVVGAGFTLIEPHDVNLCQFVHAAWLRSPVHVARTASGPWAWYQWAYTRANMRWERRAYAAARLTICPSEKIRRELLSIGLPDEGVAVIHNGVDLDEFSPPADDADRDAERAALSVPLGATVALFVGDIRTSRKNLDGVLRALRQVQDVHLVVVGALENSPFPAMAKTLGVANRVTFAGFRRDVGRFMRAADLFVFPSRYEAGTLVLTEAAACGLPLVTAATSGGAEVFGPDVAEVIDDPDDGAALVAAIRRFTADPAARRAASQAARTQAMTLSWTRMAERYVELFEAAAAARRGAAVPRGVEAE